jgi:hypothetical protein
VVRIADIKEFKTMNILANKITSNNLSAVRDLVALTGIDGEWTETGNHCQFRAVSGAILNYWKSTGTVNFQGPGLAAEEFKVMFLKHHYATTEGQPDVPLPDGHYAGW